MKAAGMRINCYIDTNVYIYAIVHHKRYGKASERLLRAIESGRIIGHGSDMVAIELLGSLSRIDPTAASRAVIAYYSLNLKHHLISPVVINLASRINPIVNIGYDAVHLAIMLLNGINSIVTYDADDWKKVEKKFEEIVANTKEDFDIKIDELKVLTPEEILSVLGASIKN